MLNFFGISVLFLDPVNFKELRISRFTPTEEIHDALMKFRPLNNGFDLIRIGSNLDGGYLAPADLKGISHCFSAGCDKNWSFERDLQLRFGIYSHIIDSEDKRPSDLSPEHSYTPKWIGTKNSDLTITLNNWIDLKSMNSDGDYLLQMDIEGFEWQALKSIDVQSLLKFRILIIEFHGTKNLINYRHFSNTFKPLIEVLTSHFDPVHIHGNNCCGVVTFGDFSFPEVFELTFHRRDRSMSRDSFQNLPSKLDSKNVVDKEDLNVMWPWRDSR